MFKRCKKSLEEFSQLDTARYIRMVKKIKEEHDNPSNKHTPDKQNPALESLTNVKSESISRLHHKVRYYL